MRLHLLPSLAFTTVALQLAVACGGTEEPSGGTGGAGGATGGSAGTGGATGGSAGTATTGGSAGTGGATGGSAGTGTAGTGGAMGGAAGTGTAGTGTAGTGTAGTGGGGAMDFPADSSQPGLEAFLTAMDYRDPEWKAGNAMPMDGMSLHGLDQIWYNRTLRQSKVDGKGTSAMPHTTGSMVVKEMYTGTNVVGRAVMLRTSATTNQWIYYCTSSEAGRCTTTSMPNQASYSMTVGSCSCHGAGTIVTGADIPAP